jgi:hypothetical protein
MKKLLVLAVLLIGCICLAQNTDTDYPIAARIMFSDGTDIQLQCAPGAAQSEASPSFDCRVMRGTSTSVVTRINLGFKMKHGYILLVK